jgi:hypothetical protein
MGDLERNIDKLIRADTALKDEGQQVTKGLAKYGWTEVIFSICNSVVL